jgi:hypothetical protein
MRITFDDQGTSAIDHLPYYFHAKGDMTKPEAVVAIRTIRQWCQDQFGPQSAALEGRWFSTPHGWFWFRNQTDAFWFKMVWW